MERDTLLNELELAERTTHTLRWQGIMMLGHRYNIAEHQHQTTVYCTLLCKYLNLDNAYDVNKGNLLQYANTHDTAEIITSDVSAAVKQEIPELKRMLDEMEDRLFETQLNSLYTPVTETEKFIVKVADYICIRRELQMELDLGNRTSPIRNAVGVVNRIRDLMMNKSFPNVPVSLKSEIQRFLVTCELWNAIREVT